MYDIYHYHESNGYNIVRLRDGYTVEYCKTLAICLYTHFAPSHRYAVAEFEQKYECKRIMTVDSLSDLEQNYPELFV